MNTQFKQNPPSYNECITTNSPQQNETVATYNQGNNETTLTCQPVSNVVNQPQVVMTVQLKPEQTKTPCVVQCPKCNKMVATKVAMVEGSYAFLCSCLICCLGGGACCLCLIPYCSDAFKDAVHRCPVCSTRLGTCKV